ncbi:ASC domain containing protein [Asbolus verrucosus]|uniref:ASC domain containing protein n=1 Tax=Asbolus verrucosus TaxID=1661398 RepID=A0A482V0C6_ASBVE|nr:ASC domain containing protein [Asbolus verrucosus]
MNHFQDEENRNDQTDACVNIRGYFKQYCASSSIHGFQYLGEERSVFERIWWIIVFVIVLSGCSFMIYKIYEKYETSPVIVSFATKDTPIYKIPFPSITICPVTKSVKEKFDYEKVTQKKTQGEVLTPNEEKYLQIMSLLCDDYDFETEAGNNSFINDYFDVLDEIKPDFLGNAINCKLLGDDYDCKDLFVPIMTDEGVCYSFNILDRRHIFNDLVSHYKGYHHVEDEDEEKWNMEKGYFDGVSIETYPKRALLAGASKGFNVDLVTSRQDLDYSCHAIQGFKVVLHSAVRIPKLKQEYFRLPLDQAVVVAVQPVMITTSEEVKSFDPEKRDCYFPSEISLKYFKSYSQQNCQLECITNATLHECDCVDIFMPSTYKETNLTLLQI